MSGRSSSFREPDQAGRVLYIRALSSCELRFNCASALKPRQCEIEALFADYRPTPTEALYTRTAVGRNRAQLGGFSISEYLYLKGDFVVGNQSFDVIIVPNKYHNRPC